MKRELTAGAGAVGAARAVARLVPTSYEHRFGMLNDAMRQCSIS